ncbi:aspartate racemase, putative [Babesia ovata]|uniref:Aspartate racemase, putative n=1 Tax=Babesia ovata TaxID=189622 RepID=A0A2H6KCZ2_9APIC|nr:aspartate racemase, putative [Babesia ovata]GBE60863.1 aspartate racemase, putative [Babesia ovata]
MLEDELGQRRRVPRDVDVRSAAVNQEEPHVAHDRSVVHELGLVQLVVARVVTRERQFVGALDGAVRQADLAESALEQYALRRGSYSDGGFTAEFYAQSLCPWGAIIVILVIGTG